MDENRINQPGMIKLICYSKTQRLSMRSLHVIIFIIFLRVPSIAQEVFIWDDDWGFGIADLSKCISTKKFQLAHSFPGGTLNVFVVPDGNIYRSFEVDGGLLSSNEPITWKQFKKLYDNPPRNLGDLAIAIASNSRSKIMIAMFDNVLNKTYLMSYDYLKAEFIIIGTLTNIEKLRSLVCVGDRVLAFEEKLNPFRYYNLLELNLNDLSNNKILFSIDSSLWVKDYNPSYISPSFRLFKSFDSCDSAGIYLNSLANNDSTSRFYRIDFKNKTLKFICAMDSLKRLRGVDGITSFDFLKKCKLDFDLDLNNSTDSLGNYQVLYSCPKAEQKIHDHDWEYYSDGPLDSITVEIISNTPDAANEFLLAKYQVQGLTVIGNGTSKLRILPSKKFYSIEIKKILDGIVYFNNKLFPTPGTRNIRISIDIPWFQDTVHCRIIVPEFDNAGRDTSVFLCPDRSVHQMENYLAHDGTNNGYWLEPELKGGTFIAGLIPQGDYHFLLERGNCFPDTAIVSLQYYPDIELALANDTAVYEYTFQTLTAAGKFTGQEFINWFKNDTLLNEHTRSIYFEINANIKYSIEVISDDGCIFRDSVLYRVKRYDDLWIPNVFSPNGDQVNDHFLIKSKFPLRINSLSIFDRWGNVVYSGKNGLTNDDSLKWNGNINQENAAPGIYIYHVEYENGDGKIRNKAGEILLIR